MLNKLFGSLQIYALPILCWSAAFFFWKDYITQPHQFVEKNKLAHITGTVTSAGDELSLPSGTTRGHYVIIKEANTRFIPSNINFSKFTDEVPLDATVTMSYSPEENPAITNNGIPIFSLKYKNKEYMTAADDVTWYNSAIIQKRNTAIYTTLAGFFAFGLVWWIKKRFLS